MMAMENQEKLVQCYTDVLETLSTFTYNLVEENNLDKISEWLDLVEKTSVILKRIGETQILEEVEYDLEPKEEKEEEAKVAGENSA